MSQEIATAGEMIDLARSHGHLREVRHEALCIVVVLTDGSEYTYRGDNGIFLKKQPAQRQS